MSTPSAPAPLINGYRYSHASVEIKLFGLRYQGFKSINYKSKQDRGKVRGTTVQDLGRTRGKGAADVDFEMYRQDYQNFIEQLMNGQDQFTGVHDMFFDIDVKYAENGSPTLQDIIQAVTMDEIALASTEGSDALIVKVTCSVQQIFLSGVPLFGDIDRAGLA